MVRFLSRYLPLDRLARIYFLRFLRQFLRRKHISHHWTTSALVVSRTRVRKRLLMIHFITRKLAHFTEYAILGFLAARAFRTSPRPGDQQRWFLISLTLIVVYALLDEYHQSFVPTRTGSIYDSLDRHGRRVDGAAR